jgi:hypothetical protein
MSERPVSAFFLTAAALWALWLWRRHRQNGAGSATAPVHAVGRAGGSLGKGVPFLPPVGPSDATGPGFGGPLVSPVYSAEEALSRVGGVV